MPSWHYRKYTIIYPTRILSWRTIVGADITSSDDNDEAHLVIMEDIIIIINDTDDTDPLATEDIINTPDNVQTPRTDLRNNHPPNDTSYDEGGR
jgi:hypothetical protein